MFHATKTYFLVFILALILSACASVQPARIQPALTQLSPTQPTLIPPTGSQPAPDQTSLPNPASVYCEEQGGRVEIRIPPEIIAQADQIIASFALTSGETPQLEFNPPSPSN